MPIVICGLGDEGAGRPAPVVSALVEFGSALHVLRDPGHHEAAGWAAGVRSAMSPRLAAWTQAWWWTAQAIRATPFVTAMPPARARAFADTMAARGAAAALTTIDPSVTVTAAASVSVAKIQNARHDVSRRGMLVAASTLIQPHVYVANVPRQPLLLIHPAHPGPPVPSAAELLRRLGAVAHRGRLEVARAIATEPRTAGEISALWQLDPTLVNRHLRALAAAGLARGTRRGRFVAYQLDADAVAALGTGLLALLLR